MRDEPIPFDFLCPKCGQVLQIRKFTRRTETADVYEYGIFDHCTPLTERIFFPTVREAILDFFYRYESVQGL